MEHVTLPVDDPDKQAATDGYEGVEDQKEKKELVLLHIFSMLAGD